ncbi:MAG: hypothetical protein ACLRSW_14635 [Christensenellaceae bacterium]
MDALRVSISPNSGYAVAPKIQLYRAFGETTTSGKSVLSEPISERLPSLMSPSLSSSLRNKLTIKIFPLLSAPNLEDPGLSRTSGDDVGSVAGAFGGCPNTTYGESVGCVAITGMLPYSRF